MSTKTDDTRTRLINAAGEIFAEKGFDAASVRQICSRACANLASVNYYFRDKESLYPEVVRAAACIRPSENKTLHWPPGTLPQQKLRDLIHARLKAMLGSDLLRWADPIMVRAMREPTKATEDFVVQSIRPKFDQLKAVLSELLPLGTSESDLHLAGCSIIAQCLHFRIQATITRLLVGAEEYRTYTLDRLADHIARFSLAALGHGVFLPHAEVTGVAS